MVQITLEGSEFMYYQFMLSEHEGKTLVQAEQNCQPVDFTNNSINIQLTTEAPVILIDEFKKLIVECAEDSIFADVDKIYYCADIWVFIHENGERQYELFVTASKCGGGGTVKSFDVWAATAYYLPRKSFVMNSIEKYLF